MVQQTIWPRNHTSHTKVYFNEFVANVLRDDMGSKKIQPPTSKKKKRPFFQKKKISNLDFDFEISHLRKKVFILTSELCMSNGSEVLIYLSFLLKAPMNPAKWRSGRS